MAGAATDAPAQLVEQREPEAFGVLHHHDGCFRHVDADLDDGGSDQQLRFAGGKPRHGGILLAPLHATVHEVGLLSELLA